MIPAGPILMSDIVALLPMVDELCVLEVNHDQVIAILENGVCMYPRLEGRFPQVSGIKFSFDPTQPAGERVVRDSVEIGGERIQEARCYSMCVKSYLALGKDGYCMLPECKVLLDSEVAPVLPALVRNYLSSLAVLRGFKKPARSGSLSPSILNKWKGLLTRPVAGDEETTNKSDTTGSSSALDADYRINCQTEERIVCLGAELEATTDTSVGIINSTI